MKSLNTRLLAILMLLLAHPATAEIFQCTQADGTTQFSYAPCAPREAEEPVQELTAAPLAVAYQTPAAHDISATMVSLEDKLEQLQLERDTEIANAPFSANDPTTLAELKSQIRASYQQQINDTLQELLRLREVQKDLRNKTTSR